MGAQHLDVGAHWAPNKTRWAPKHPAKIGKAVSDHTVTFGRPNF
ncbi:protein of unknown function (plasmid) [Azospirillum baldaniorum]|uniref:Uncharacterized protein n=1 Tax=Azospirillum baldaniorum TaxID=1064539 RepID=A0A9P1K1M1_9PROT|nr:protein of unknown function [Azospirillum baldaniorum]